MKFLSGKGGLRGTAEGGCSHITYLSCHYINLKGIINVDENAEQSFP
jgi:hypothetical protein